MPIDEHLLHAADALGMRLELVDGVLIAHAQDRTAAEMQADRQKVKAWIREAAGAALIASPCS